MVNVVNGIGTWYKPLSNVWNRRNIQTDNHKTVGQVLSGRQVLQSWQSFRVTRDSWSRWVSVTWKQWSEQNRSFTGATTFWEVCVWEDSFWQSLHVCWGAQLSRNTQWFDRYLWRGSCIEINRSQPIPPWTVSFPLVYWRKALATLTSIVEETVEVNTAIGCFLFKAIHSLIWRISPGSECANLIAQWSDVVGFPTILSCRNNKTEQRVCVLKKIEGKILLLTYGLLIIEGTPDGMEVPWSITLPTIQYLYIPYIQELATTLPFSRMGCAVVKFLISSNTALVDSPAAAALKSSTLFHLKVAWIWYGASAGKLRTSQPKRPWDPQVLFSVLARSLPLMVLGGGHTKTRAACGSWDSSQGRRMDRTGRQPGLGP